MQACWAVLRKMPTICHVRAYARQSVSGRLSARSIPHPSKRRLKETAWGKTEPASRFLKPDPDGICDTLRAGTGSDQGTFTSPRPIHPYSPRCITVCEAARLHTYPD